MTNTTRLAMPLLSAAQAQKHVTHNIALEQLDAMVSAYALGFVAAPLGGESDGAAYIVTTGTGVFTGWDGALMYLISTVWVPVLPTDGFRVWLTNERRLYVFRALLGVWVPVTRARPDSGFGLAIFYVDPAGDDAHDGSIGSPWASVAHALSVFNDYDCAGNAMVVQLVDGAGSEDVFVDRLPHGAASLIIQGNLATPANVTGYTFSLEGDARVRIDGLETESIFAAGRADVDLLYSNMRFAGTGSNTHLSVSDTANISASGMADAISGNFGQHMFVGDYGAQISYLPASLTITGTPTCSTFGTAYLGGLIYAYGWNAASIVTGSLTGQRHYADINGIITTGGYDFPGSTAGTATKGGHFD